MARVYTEIWLEVWKSNAGLKLTSKAVISDARGLWVSFFAMKYAMTVRGRMKISGKTFMNSGMLEKKDMR